MHKLIIFLNLLLFTAGCATAPPGAAIVDNPADLPSIQAEQANRLAKIKIGMSLDEFRKVFPEAYISGQNQDTTAYEIVKLQKYVTQSDINRQNFWWGVGSPHARSNKQVLWFYFYKEVLVRWGRPQDWPDKPDLIIEKRNR